MRTVYFTILIFLISWLTAFSYFLYLIPSDNYIYKDDYNKAEAIVILTGDNNRIQNGLELLNNSNIKYVLISGVAPGTNFLQIIQHFENKENYLKKSNIIELGKKATSTVGNLAETQEWISKKHFKSIILVTSNYHMPRSYALFNKKLAVDNIIIYPTFSEKFDKNNWWRDPKSIELILLEFHKYIACKIALFFSNQ